VVTLATTWTDILIAAPLGFLFGMIFGIWAAARFIIAVPRDHYKIMKRNGEPYKEE
jgi:hypothetical protein